MTRFSRLRSRSVRADAGPRRPLLTGRQVTTMVVVSALAFSLYPVAQIVAPMVNAAGRDPMDSGGERGILTATGDIALVEIAPAQVLASLPAQSTADAGSVGAVLPQVVDPEPSIVETPNAATGECLLIDAAGAGAASESGLPQLSRALERSLEAYGRDPADLSAESWMSSGGRFGGGIPWAGVRPFLRRGAAAGLSDDQLMALLNNPSFMRAANDPDGGAGLLGYIGDHPELFAEVAGFSAGAPFAAGWGATSGQARLFGAFPELGAVYAAMAGPIHTSGRDYGAVDQLLDIAQQGGTWGELARRRLDEVLTYGPRARSADAAMARYVAGSGYVPMSPEAVAGRDYWVAYAQHLEEVRSGFQVGLSDDLPTAPTGAAKPMALTWPARSAAC